MALVADLSEAEAHEKFGYITLKHMIEVSSNVVAAELEAYPDAIVTDVASVKLAVYDELRARGADLSRYIGTHPMAGRERGGPSGAPAKDSPAPRAGTPPGAIG